MKTIEEIFGQENIDDIISDLKSKDIELPS